MRNDLPAGTVTLVFTDIDGSTKLLHELGTDAYALALAEHRRVLREAFGNHGGVEVDTSGDAFLFAFSGAPEALLACAEGRDALRTGPIQVRVGVHTGMPHVGPEGYVGHDVHLGSRIGAAGHGGQVLLSAAARAAAGIDDGALHDLGEHRLKDFAEAVRLFQLGVERFPPLKTISNTNLPRPASSFVGREQEVAGIVALIRVDGARLVTLTGPGGSGKTRLAIESATELVGDHNAGTFWVELAPVRDPALVMGAIAATLGASGGLADHIAQREMLLVLDNLEQVLGAGPAIADVVETCPNLRVLVTSRERLRVRGEVEYQVHPLAEPDAVALFSSRAGLAEADATIPALCRALDAMPLAIELAAARAKVLAPAQVLERLAGRLDLLTGGRDADPRQRTLRSTIEWSHDLLGTEEQRLFARLGVLAGAFTLDAAEQITGAQLDSFQSLVEKSLVSRTGDRYRMYETIRGFAVERLDASGEADDIGRRHAGYFLAQVEEAAPGLIRESLGRSGEWTDRIEKELDDIRVATDRFEAQGDSESALRMAGALIWFCEERGHIGEFRRRVDWALAADRRPSLARAGALIALAGLASWMGDRDVARRAGEEALAFHREHGNAWQIGDDVHTLGVIAAESDDWLTARTHFEEAERLFREAGDEDYALWATHSIAWTYQETGALARAREIDEANILRAREAGNRSIEGTSLAVLGTLRLAEGNATEAIPFIEQAYRLHREVGQPVEVSIDLWRLADALAAVDRAEDAVEVASLSAALREELGSTVPWVDHKMGKMLDDLRRRLGPDAFVRAWDRGKRLDPDAAVAVAVQAIG